MMPAVLEPVHLADAEDRQLPAIVTEVDGDHLFTLRMDDGAVGPVGTLYDLIWSRPTSIQQVQVIVVERLLVDGVPSVRVNPRGSIIPVQRRNFVRVPVQRPITLALDPIPLDAQMVTAPTSAVGLTLDVAEAALRCSIRAEDADAFVTGAGVDAEFSVAGEEFNLPGEVFRVRNCQDEEPPRVELVVTIKADETSRRALRKALFAEQVAMRGRDL